MAIKKYHVSKNLIPEIRNANGWVIGYRQQNNGAYVSINNNGEWLSPKISIASGNKITISAMAISSSSMTVYFWNGDIYISSASRSDYSGSTFTAPEGTTQIDFAIRAGADKKTETDIISSGFWVMLNTGSTPLPYEPYGNTWNSIPYRKYGTETDTLTSLPADVIADGQSASAVIKGNMSQSGTPTPSSPIYPTETGDKTANLCNESDVIYDGTRDVSYMKATPYHLLANESITVSLNYNATAIWLVNASNDIALSLKQDDNTLTYSRTSTLNVYIKLRFDNGIPSDLKVMLNIGSTALPYQPYGIQIPISSGGTTTNVYLGEVQSERQIKQIILKGGEVTTVDASVGQALINVPSANKTLGVIPISSHYVGKVVTAWGQLSNGEVGLVNNGTTIRICDTTNVTSVSNFNAYLTEQYNNGTPVCIWYVLSVPQTTILNEPLRKIGTYADSVSVTGIPTTGTAEQFDVDTTLKPSEVGLTYHGWHEHQPEKYVGGGS